MTKPPVPNLKQDLCDTVWIRDKIRQDDRYAQNVYAALCNQAWQRNDVWPLLADETWHCSWRYAGGIIANVRCEGDYLDWYCSGIAGGDEPDVYDKGRDLNRRGYVGEGTVTDEIREDFFRLGWIPVPYNDDKQ